LRGFDYGQTDGQTFVIVESLSRLKNISRFESRHPLISIKKNVISHEKYQNQPFLSSRQCSKDSYIKNVSYQN